jgi:hypothetical protein
MGHRPPPEGYKNVSYPDLTWLVNRWDRLPSEVKMTIMTVARSVLASD